MKTLAYFSLALLLSGSITSSYAQTFSENHVSAGGVTSAEENINDISDSSQNDALRNLFTSSQATSNTTLTDNKTGTEKEATDDDIIPEDELYRLNTPTVDGSERGGEAFVMRDEEGKLHKVTNIFLFYDEFKIHHAFGNFTSCDVRFNILSNLDRKITQLDVKLVWPDLTTTLSFHDVPPYTQQYYNYTLLGKGCYSLDKAPNIVVNRCRAKGLTSVECAKKILWVYK